jgi:hypothetical protein
MRTLAAALLAALIWLTASPAGASALTSYGRCVAMVDELNRWRADLPLSYPLCKVGYSRARAMAYAGRGWHDLNPLKRELAARGICWEWMGEVIASTTRTPSGYTFMYLWRTIGKTTHWDPVLMARRANRAGGSWATVNGKSFAAFYVYDRCGV